MLASAKLVTTAHRWCSLGVEAANTCTLLASNLLLPKNQGECKCGKSEREHRRPPDCKKTSPKTGRLQRFLIVLVPMLLLLCAHQQPESTTNTHHGTTVTTTTTDSSTYTTSTGSSSSTCLPAPAHDSNASTKTCAENPPLRQAPTAAAFPTDEAERSKNARNAAKAAGREIQVRRKKHEIEQHWDDCGEDLTPILWAQDCLSSSDSDSPECLLHDLCMDKSTQAFLLTDRWLFGSSVQQLQDHLPTTPVVPLEFLLQYFQAASKNTASTTLTLSNFVGAKAE